MPFRKSGFDVGFVACVVSPKCGIELIVPICLVVLHNFAEDVMQGLVSALC